MKHTKADLSNSIIKVGITGGIGAGKSIIGKVLTVLGYPVYYSDKEAKLLMNEDQELRKELMAVFGKQAYVNDELNRPFLAKCIFNDPSLKEKMNALVHPKVRKRFNEWASKQSAPIVFNEAAILFETGAYTQFDFTILVVADEELRIHRVQQRDDMSREEVLARMKNQWSDEEKKTLASFIIENNSNNLIVPQVEEVISTILKRKRTRI